MRFMKKIDQQSAFKVPKTIVKTTAMFCSINWFEVADFGVSFQPLHILRETVCVTHAFERHFSRNCV